MEGTRCFRALTAFMLAMLLPGILIGLVILGFFVFFAHRMAKAGNTHDLMGLPAKLLVTALLLGLVGYGFYRGHGNKTWQLLALFFVLMAGIPLVVMWLPPFISTVLQPLFGSLTGGSEEVEVKPMYFRAHGLRKRGDYAGAIAMAERELARFPDDLEGQLLIADIRAVDLKDPAVALAGLAEILVQPGRSANDLCLTLDRMADLQLNRLNQPEAAGETLRRIVEGFTDTEAAQLARQRLAHLPGAQQLAEKAERPRLVVTRHEERLGLTEDLGASALPAADGELRARELLVHLEQFPDDWESREQLARIYVDPLNRLDLAFDQMERLISQTSAAPKHVVRWLNELADLQLKAADGTGAAKLTLERIVACFPSTPWAEQAEARIRHLAWDRRGKEAPRTLRLGSYEQNIGLKRRDPTIPDPSKGGV